MNPSSDAAFGTRLRRERERRRITLSAIAANTKISMSLLHGLENGDVSRWPPGIFRRSFVRSYASAVGLDADEITREFLERFPDPNDPVPAAPASTAFEPHGAAGSTLRLTLVDSPSTFVRGPIVPASWRRWAAVTWDVFAVLAMGAILFIGLGEFWMPVALATIAYYASSIVLLGNTPGVSFFAAANSSGGGTNAHRSKPPRRWLRLFTRSAGEPLGH